MLQNVLDKENDLGVLSEQHTHFDGNTETQNLTPTSQRFI